MLYRRAHVYISSLDSSRVINKQINDRYLLRASLWWTNVRVCCCRAFGGNEDEFLVWGTMWIVLPISGDVLTTCTWWGMTSETNGNVGGEELDSDDVLLYRALSLLSSASLVTMLASLSVSKSPFILVATAGKRSTKRYTKTYEDRRPTIHYRGSETNPSPTCKFNNSFFFF